MDTRHLRAAVAVARHGSFTVAARELFMTQSTVSRQVAALERDLGRRLFVRNVGAVRLTRAGEAFLPEAEKVLQAVESALDAARAATGGERVVAPQNRLRELGGVGVPSA